VETKAFRFWKYIGVINNGIDVDEAQISLYKGDIINKYGKIKDGEYDLYYFTIPDLGHDQLAIIKLSWFRDWTKWATSDLDILIYDEYGYLYNVDGATGKSLEFAQLVEPGFYYIMIDGYQVYFDNFECYHLQIIYFSNLKANWQSKIFTIDSWITFIRIPNRKKGIAILWLHSLTFGYWYIGDFIEL